MEVAREKPRAFFNDAVSSSVYIEDLTVDEFNEFNILRPLDQKVLASIKDGTIEVSVVNTY